MRVYVLKFSHMRFDCNPVLQGDSCTLQILFLVTSVWHLELLYSVDSQMKICCTFHVALCYLLNNLCYLNYYTLHYYY